jgi:hypothetical protein
MLGKLAAKRKYNNYAPVTILRAAIARMLEVNRMLDRILR